VLAVIGREVVLRAGARGGSPPSESRATAPVREPTGGVWWRAEGLCEPQGRLRKLKKCD